MKIIAICGACDKSQALNKVLSTQLYNEFKGTEAMVNCKQRLLLDRQYDFETIVIDSPKLPTIKGIIDIRKNYHALRIETPKKFTLFKGTLVLLCNDDVSAEWLIKQNILGGQQIDEIYLYDPLNLEDSLVIKSEIDKHLLRDRQLCLDFANWCIGEGFTSNARNEDFANFVERYLYRYR